MFVCGWGAALHSDGRAGSLHQSEVWCGCTRNAAGCGGTLFLWGHVPVGLTLLCCSVLRRPALYPAAISYRQSRRLCGAFVRAIRSLRLPCTVPARAALSRRPVRAVSLARGMFPRCELPSSSGPLGPDNRSLVSLRILAGVPPSLSRRLPFSFRAAEHSRSPGPRIPGPQISGPRMPAARVSPRAAPICLHQFERPDLSEANALATPTTRAPRSSLPCLWNHQRPGRRQPIRRLKVRRLKIRGQTLRQQTLPRERDHSDHTMTGSRAFNITLQACSRPAPGCCSRRVHQCHEVPGACEADSGAIRSNR